MSWGAKNEKFPANADRGIVQFDAVDQVQHLVDRSAAGEAVGKLGRVPGIEHQHSRALAEQPLQAVRAAVLQPLAVQDRDALQGAEQGHLADDLYLFLDIGLFLGLFREKSGKNGADKKNETSKFRMAQRSKIN